MGAIAAVGAAVTAIASSVGIAITAAAVTVGFETIAAVGAVLGVVGQVTHNKALGYAGLALGAVGGIGALASSAGLLGADAADLGAGAGETVASADAASAGSLESVAGSGEFAAADSATGLPSELSGGAAAAEGSGNAAVDSAMGLPPGLDGGASAVGEILPASSDAPPGIGHATGNDAGTTTQSATDVLNDKELARVRGGGLLNGPSGATPTPDLTTTTAPTTPVTSQPLPGPTPGVGGNGAVPDMSAPAWKTATTKLGMIPAAGDEGGSGAFSGLLDFANKNPVVALGMLQTAGSFLAGATSTLTPAQVKALNSQAAANDAATAQQKQMTTNLQAPKSVASSAPVTGAPQTLVPPPTASPPPATGFINQPPVQQPRVTGMAA